MCKNKKSLLHFLGSLAILGLGFTAGCLYPKNKPSMSVSMHYPISEVRAIQGVGTCPQCEDKLFEIDHSFASKQEIGTCRNCEYSFILNTETGEKDEFIGPDKLTKEE